MSDFRGDLRPSEIPDRAFGSTLAAALLGKTGRRPSRVICYLHRIKLDTNREIVEAAHGSPMAEQA